MFLDSLIQRFFNRFHKKRKLKADQQQNQLQQEHIPPSTSFSELSFTTHELPHSQPVEYNPFDMPPKFCCPRHNLQPRSAVRTPSERELWHFAWCMSLPSPPAHSPSGPNPEPNYSLPTPDKSPYTSSPPYSPPSPHSPRPLAYLLSVSPFAIQYEKWAQGCKIAEEYFIPDTEEDGMYFEVGKACVWRDFLRNWDYVKVVCDHSPGVFYIVKFLERVEVGSEVRFVKRWVYWDADGDEESREEGMEASDESESGGEQTVEDEEKSVASVEQGSDGDDSNCVTSDEGGNLLGKRQHGELDDDEDADRVTGGRRRYRWWRC